MDWLILAALGIMWAAFLVPSARRRPSPSATVEDFERRMELLAQAERHGEPGRWIITPRKGVRFVGTAERARARARARRKRVLAFLLESGALAFLIGLVPPLRAMWIASAVLGGLLLVYAWALVALTRRPGARAARPRAPTPEKRPASAPRWGLAEELRATTPGGPELFDGEDVHVVVRPASEVGVAGG